MHHIYLRLNILLCWFVTTAIAVHPVCASASTEKGVISGKAQFSLSDPGTEDIVDYKKYGAFTGVGAYSYAYTIKDKNGLANASGEGIDPNDKVTEDPAYRELLKAGKLRRPHWEHVNTDNPQRDFFSWATATDEDPGVRLYFTGRALEAGGLYRQAVKCYYAAMILYPHSFCWDQQHRWTWLIAPAAWSAVIDTLRIHPEIGLKLVDTFVRCEPSIKGDPTHNDVAVTPGTFVRWTQADRAKARSSFSKAKVVERRGGKVSCVKYDNGQWALEVDGKPFFIKGIHYAPTRIGCDYNWNWMAADQNKNGLNDVAYETWIDANGNGVRDADEPVLGDFELLKRMGCNTIRILNTLEINKPLLRDLYKRFGIRVFICEPMGAYTVHSRANWADGTDYADPDQCGMMREYITQMVGDYKDEPWLLGYILGNENNMPCDYSGVNATRTRAARQPDVYAKFLGEMAELVHRLDPEHIVGVGNLSLGLVDSYAKHAPALDFLGINEYAGQSGFGSLWIRARAAFDRPVLITEYGCDSYWTTKGVDEDAQAIYHRNNWNDIYYNSAGNPGEGNSIGGIIFEWCDEWWKDTQGDPYDKQATRPTVEMAFPDGWSNEEWFGIVGQGRGHSSPFMRVPRKTYYMYRDELWGGRFTRIDHG